jgi:hypothetical protein
MGVTPMGCGPSSATPPFPHPAGAHRGQPSHVSEEQRRLPKDLSRANSDSWDCDAATDFLTAFASAPNRATEREGDAATKEHRTARRGRGATGAESTRVRRNVPMAAVYARGLVNPTMSPVSASTTSVESGMPFSISRAAAVGISGRGTRR